MNKRDKEEQRHLVAEDMEKVSGNDGGDDKLQTLEGVFEQADKKKIGGNGHAHVGEADDSRAMENSDDIEDVQAAEAAESKSGKAQCYAHAF